MKRIYLFFLVILLPIFSFSKMNFSGTYTIGGASPNFASIGIAVDSLKKGIVIGSTVFKIRKGTYNEKIILTIIKGTSSIHTVTFTSETGIASDVIISNMGGGTNADHAVIKLRGTEFFIFDKLTILNSNPNIGSNFFLTKACSDITISNCILKVDSSLQAGQYVMRSNIVVADTPTIDTKAPNPGLDNGSGKNASNILIEKNYFSGGDIGMVLVGGVSIALNKNFRILNNYFSGEVKGAFKMKSAVDVLEFIGNSMNHKNAVTNSNFQSVSFSSFLSNAKINFNKIILSTNNNNLSYGFYLIGLTTSEVLKNQVENASIGAFNFVGGSENLIANNTCTAFKGLASQNVFGMKFSDGNRMKIYHNSVNMNLANNPNAINFPIVIENASRMEMANNIFYNSANGPVISTTTEAFTNSNFNDFYTGGAVFSYYDGQTAPNLKIWITQTEMDDRSISINPNFISATNLHTVNPLLDGVGVNLPLVLDDLDGESRNIFAPDLGADEFYLKYPAIDLGISFALPKNLNIVGNVLTVSLKNFGTESLNGKSIDLIYSIDGGTTWTNPEKVIINSLGELFAFQNYSFGQQFSFTSSGTKNIKIKMLNSLTGDINATNDLFSYDACLGLISNVYTIGTGGDFTTINSALLMLKNLSCGISGPIVFNIKPGTYNERLTVVPIKGASATNTITFQSSTAKQSDVIISSRGGATNVDYHTLRLLHASYYNFKNLTIENTNTQFGAAVQLAKYSHHIVFKKCVLKVDTTPAEDNSVSRVTLIVADSGSNGTIYVGSFPITGSSSGCDNITVDSCKLLGMDYAFYLPGGSDSNQFTNNTIIIGKQQGSTYSGAIYADGLNHFRFEDNLVQMSPLAQQGTRNGLHLAILNNSIINNNTIMYANNYGIGVFYANNSIISNNRIIKFVQNIHADGTNTIIANSGLYFNGCNNSYILHNSVLMDLVASTSAPISTYCLRVNAGKNLTVKNNIFSNTGGGFLMYTSFTTGGNPLKVCDYNNYYYPGGSFGRLNTLSYPTLTQWQTALKLDSNSINENPLFTSAIDLHTVNPKLNAKGSPNQVKTDMDKEPRNRYTPDMGADEFIIEEIDLGLESFSPSLMKLGDNNVDLTIINHGKNSLKGKSFSISFSLDSGQTWINTGNYTVQNLLSSFSTETISISKPININKIGQGQLCFRIDAGSLIGDIYPRNDEVCQNICVSLTPGTYSVGSSTANFLNLAAVVNVLKSAVCPLEGHLIFELENGSYTDTLFLDTNIKSSINSSLTFKSKSGNSQDVIIQSNADIIKQGAVIRLSGMNYVNLENLTIKNLGVQNGTGISIENKSSNIKVQNCRVIMDSTSNSPTIGISVLNSSESILIKDNIVFGGNYGISLFGGNEIALNQSSVIGNTIISCYGNPIYIQGDNVKEVTSNKIFMKMNNEFGIGIFVSSLTRQTIISKNYLSRCSYSGILLEDINPSNYSLVSNNMITGGFGDNLSGSGIYINNSHKLNIFHNSVLYDANGSKGKAIRIAQSENIDLKNNIFINSKDGFSFYVEANNNLKSSDYNVLFTNGSNVAFVGANQSFAQLQILGYEKNGYNINVPFQSAGDLHCNTNLVDGKGLGLEEVIDDFDNQPRDKSNPDIGCDEFSSNGVDVFVSKIQLQNNKPIPGENQTVQMEIGNLGSIAANSIVLKYSIDGLELASENYPGSILPGGSDTYSFIAKWTPNSEKKYTICGSVFVNSDINTSNDNNCSEIEVINVGLNADLFLNGIYLYPNPNIGQFIIELENPNSNNYFLVDRIGRVLQQGKLTNKKNWVDIKNPMPGIYLLVIEKDGKLINKKFILN